MNELRTFAPTRVALTPRDERSIDSMARWMGLLGRFRVLAGGLLMLAVLGVALAYATTEALEGPAGPSDTTPPLVRLGALSTRALALLGTALMLLGGLVLRGGVLLDDAAEDFERIVHGSGPAERHLESALRRLRAFFRLELWLVALALGAALTLRAGWLR